MKQTLIIVLALAVISAPVEASFEKIGVGCRAIGLGTAYVAVASDASAIYWNPAGIACSVKDSLVQRNLALTYSPLFGLSYLQHKFVGYTQDRLSRRTNFGALGFGIIELSLSPNAEDAQSLNYIENTVLVSWACLFDLPFGQKLAIGATGKYYHAQTGRPVSGFGADLGLLTERNFSLKKFAINMRWAAQAQDVGKSRIWYRAAWSPDYQEFIEPQYRLGSAIAIEWNNTFSPRMLFSVALHRNDRYSLHKNEINCGAELSFLSSFALRLGIKDIHTPRYGFGISLVSPRPFCCGAFVVMEAAILTHPELNPTFTFSLSLRSGRRP